ncbi:hypothetical protein GCM10017783_13690 [Deinococcus piscis]|uniref:Prepilin-type N-terminal cleavage/methylation domain-containing protein n=1 Tax=Deinococcus piscis TaxID=394230 RepID=A0ABQ3K6X6_9DEIO|nr:type II secretion system protein [Deinococcus piscis]GHG02615.1 hypothetical protein GCM10017783_13690 [Deinococcus piscis]
MKNNTAGFTLIELLIVIAIIGILAAVLIPNLLGAQKRAYDAGAQSCGKSIQTALAMHYVDNRTYAAPTPAVSKTMEGAASACSAPEITVTAGTATQNDYSFVVLDTRGAKKFR